MPNIVSYDNYFAPYSIISQCQKPYIFFTNANLNNHGLQLIRFVSASKKTIIQPDRSPLDPIKGNLRVQEGQNRAFLLGLIMESSYILSLDEAGQLLPGWVVV